MYVLWVRRLKKLNKTVKLWIRVEKENEEPELYEDLMELREYIGPVSPVRLSNRLSQQEFVTFTEEQELFEKMEIAVKRFNALVTHYSIPPESHSVVPFSEL